MNKDHLSILIVDDDKDIIDVAQSHLCRLTELIYTANSIIEAKKILKDKRIDLVLSDHIMPKGSGLSLLKWLKKNSPHTKFIVMSAFLNRGNELDEFLLQGANEILFKPFSRERLKNAVARMISTIEAKKWLESFNSTNLS